MAVVVELNIKFKKFHNDLLKGLRVDLKTFLVLAMPNHCCQIVEKKMWDYFLVIFLSWKPQTFMIPNVQLLLYRMILACRNFQLE